MSLTSTQRTTLANFINGDAAINTQPMNTEGAGVIAAYLNDSSSSTFIVWRTSVPLNEIMGDVGFDWTRVDNLSVGKARVWEWMKMSGAMNPSQANIRGGVDAVWVGTQADLNVRTAVYVHFKRVATRFEKLFAVGTGSSASPATLVIEGAVSSDDVADARENG